MNEASHRSRTREKGCSGWEPWTSRSRPLPLGRKYDPGRSVHPEGGPDARREPGSAFPRDFPSVTTPTGSSDQHPAGGRRSAALNPARAAGDLPAPTKRRVTRQSEGGNEETMIAKEKLIEVVGAANVADDAQTLAAYSKDTSFVNETRPAASSNTRRRRGETTRRPREPNLTRSCRSALPSALPR